jgi:SAM-dependent methyltransferase
MDLYDLQFEDAAFDAVHALNCLLHVSKADIGDVLLGIRRVMKPDGLFYMGLYGGNDSEGIWENDWCEPKRFFASYSDDSVRNVVEKFFEVVYFKTVSLEQGKPHFQSLILRKTGAIN